MRYTTAEKWTMAAIFGALFLMVAVGWPLKSSMEASAYNRITGGDVTTWEAMWVQLRVDCR